MERFRCTGDLGDLASAESCHGFVDVERKEERSPEPEPPALNYSRYSDNADCIALYFSEQIAREHWVVHVGRSLHPWFGCALGDRDLAATFTTGSLD